MTVSGPCHVSDFKTLTRIHCLLDGGLNFGIGVKRTNALSPLTANILILYANGYAGRVRRLRARAGRCATALRLNTAATDCSGRRDMGRAFPARRVAHRLMRRILGRFINRVRRIPPACDTIGIGNSHSCTLHETNRRIRLGPGAIHISRVRLASCGSRRGATDVHIIYNGNACVQSLTHSVNHTLSDNTFLATLHHAGTKDFSMRGYVSFSRFRR